MIPGFAISGPGTKRILLRAVGPTLTDYGVTGFLEDPQISLVGSSVANPINDNWNDAVDAPAIQQASQLVSAFDLPDGSKDAVLLVDLPQGQYSLQISGVADATGVALAEVYDADDASDRATLVNISNRGYVGVGGDIMIPGFVVAGNASKTLLIRAVGPTLFTDYGVTGVLENPLLRFYQGDAAIAENDDWESSSLGPLAAELALQVGAFDLHAGSLDAALVITLTPGVYTVQASGVGGTDGNALVEVYEVN